MKQRLVILIIILSLFLVGSAASAQTVDTDQMILTTVPGVLSGGPYILTIQSKVEAQPDGYRLLDSIPAADLATGCCCKNYMPCMNK